MKLIELISGIDIECCERRSPQFHNIGDFEITDISSDSREIIKGSLFVCIKGRENDGHRYIGDAIKAGASAVLTEKGGDFDRSLFEGEDAPVHFEAENTRRALAFLFDAWYSHPAKNMKLIAVTGTNGKTSVTFMLRSIFEAAMIKTGLIGTVCSYS